MSENLVVLERWRAWALCDRASIVLVKAATRLKATRLA